EERLGGKKVTALSDFINLYLLPGLVVGCIYALGAIGISLLFGILRFAHFAHGDMMTLGAYLAIIFTANLGWSPYAALPVAVIGTAIAALALDRAFYKPFRRSAGIVTVIASFGFMKIAPRQVTIVLVTAALVVALHLFLSRTRLGKAMRAVSDDADLARVS